MAKIKALKDNGKLIYPATIGEAVVVDGKKLTAKVSEIETNISSNTTAISEEETRAKAAEQANSTAISSEASARESADTTLQSNIDSEATRAQAAEQANASEIASVKETLASVKELSPQVEGWVKVSGISDPAFQTEYKKTNGDSVFDDWKPCLIEQGTGKVIKWLNPLDLEEDENGNTAAIDGSEGEVMIAPKTKKYAILGRKLVGTTYYEVSLWSNAPFYWQGYASEEIERVAASPHFCVRHTDDDNVVRMHSVYNPEWNGDANSSSQLFTGLYVYTQNDDGTVTETYDETLNPSRGAAGKASVSINLPNGEQYAMNMNEDTTKTYPFYNSTAREVELFGCRMWAEFGTYDVHKKSLLGSGYCTNDVANAATYWEESNADAVNGWRYIDSAGNYVYGNFSTQKVLNDATYKYVAYYNIDDWRSPWRIMEQQRALAYAIKNGIAELTWFAFEGAKYKWRSVDGVSGPNEGVMTAVIWKYIKTKLKDECTDPDNDGADMSGVDVEVLVCSGVYRGRITDVSPSWWTSGLIATEDENGAYKWYMQRDQKLLVKSPTADRLTAADAYDFEKNYELVFETPYKSAFISTMNDRALMMPASNTDYNGGLHTYVCHFVWSTGSKPSAGYLAVRGFRRGSNASLGVLSAWTVYGYRSPSVANAFVGFGTVCLLT